jgi:hypothetical protein
MTHLDTDVLAEFRAGLITGRRAAKIAAHLAGCDHCAALDDRLAGVSVLLASVPAPVLPETVAQRLETVLAAEVEKRNYPERAGADPSPDRESHKRPARHQGSRLLRMRVLAPVGVAVALLAAGGYGLSLIGSGPAVQAASSSAGRAASAADGGAEPAAGQPGAKPKMMPTARFTAVSSGTDYRRATLGQQLKAEMSAAPALLSRALSGKAMACVRLVTSGANPVFVDSARFEGQPATIVVARTGQHDAAWVTVPDCSTTGRDVLYKTTLPPGISGP